MVSCPVHYYRGTKVVLDRLAEGQISISLSSDEFNNSMVTGRDGFCLRQVTQSICTRRGFPTKSRVSSAEFRSSLRISTNFQNSRSVVSLDLVFISIGIFA